MKARLHKGGPMELNLYSCNPPTDLPGEALLGCVRRWHAAPMQSHCLALPAARTRVHPVPTTPTVPSLWPDQDVGNGVKQRSCIINAASRRQNSMLWQRWSTVHCATSDNELHRERDLLQVFDVPLELREQAAAGRGSTERGRASRRRVPSLQHRPDRHARSRPLVRLRCVQDALEVVTRIAHWQRRAWAGLQLSSTVHIAMTEGFPRAGGGQVQELDIGSFSP